MVDSIYGIRLSLTGGRAVPQKEGWTGQGMRRYLFSVGHDQESKDLGACPNPAFYLLDDLRQIILLL